MNEPLPTQESCSTPQSLLAANAVGNQPASELRQLWEQGQAISTHGYLADHPEYLGMESVILDLAYEEWHLRLEAGETVDPTAFAARFEPYGVSLTKLLSAAQVLEQRAEQVDGAGPRIWPQVGQTLAGFCLRRELGRGAFARVFLADDPALGNRQVALKISRSGSREAWTLGRLSHPNIVPVYSVHPDLASGFTVVCMPYLRGATLESLRRHILAGGRVPERADAILDVVQHAAEQDTVPAGTKQEEPHPVLRRGTFADGICHLAVQLAEALACIHAQGICHRDLKPANVLLSAQGRPVLLDFNLSFDAARQENQLGGTLPYMAPEQLRAHLATSPAAADGIDPAADVFSLGVLLYELLAGAHPFVAIPENVASRPAGAELLRRQEQGVVSLRQRNPVVDARLSRRIESCLAFEATARPTAAALANSLRDCLSWKYRVPRWVASHRVLSGAVAALVVAVVLTAGYLTADYSSHRGQRAYRAGVEDYHAGRYQEALTHFDEAVRVGPPSADCRFARGRTRLALGSFADAASDFQEADRLRPDGRTKACCAFCWSQVAAHHLAIVLNTQAADEGFATAAVYNNRAFSQLHAENRWEEAAGDLERALRLNRGLQAAWRNRAEYEFKRANAKGPNGYLPLAGVEAIDRALALGPEHADLWADAARHCATIARAEEQRACGALAVMVCLSGSGVKSEYWLAQAAVNLAAEERWAIEAEHKLAEMRRLGAPEHPLYQEELIHWVYERRGPVPALSGQDRGLERAPLALVDPVEGLGD